LFLQTKDIDVIRRFQGDEVCSSTCLENKELLDYVGVKKEKEGMQVS